MRILVFGAGALGSVLGGLLAARHDVRLVGRAPHIDAIRTNGLRVEGIRTFTVRLAADAELRPGPAPDLVIVTVPAHQTADAARRLRAGVAPGAVVASCQNGLGTWEALRHDLPDHTVLAAPVTYGAQRVAPGVVRYNGEGEILVGGAPTDADAVRRVVRGFLDAGLRARGVDDLQGVLWQKAIVNAAINPLSALTGRTNGELVQDSDLCDRMRRVVDECVAAAAAVGVRLPEPDVFGLVVEVARRTAPNHSSMLDALERGRRTEIDEITGALVEAGAAHGVPMPENEALWRAVRAREGRPRTTRPRAGGVPTATPP